MSSSPISSRKLTPFTASITTWQNNHSHGLISRFLHGSFHYLHSLPFVFTHPRRPRGRFTPEQIVGPGKVGTGKKKMVGEEKSRFLPVPTFPGPTICHIRADWSNGFPFSSAKNNNDWGLGGDCLSHPFTMERCLHLSKTKAILLFATL